MKIDESAQGYEHAFEIESIRDIIDLCVGDIQTAAPLYMYRGQANIDWHLHSSAYRRLEIDGVPDEKKLMAYEKRLLERATHRGFRFDGGRTLTDFELLARLQHHGAATRLVDVTRNVFVALYFACSELPETDGCVFGVKTGTIGGKEKSLLQDDYDTVMKAIGGMPFPHVWQAPDVSPRVAAQHSQFLYSEIQSSEHGSIAIANPKFGLMSMRIKAEAKPHFLLQLNRAFDISAATLFPDLDGFGVMNAPSQSMKNGERW